MSGGAHRDAGGPWRAPLPGGRWHFQHGPIDLVIGLDGETQAVERALEALWQRFATALAELAAELPLLRAPVQEAGALRGAIARRMVSACMPHLPSFITPMAAVAGAVADELMDEIRTVHGVRRAYINNGGDIALHVTPGAHHTVGMMRDFAGAHGHKLVLDGSLRLDHESGVAGVATSGWRGRSFSLGIADSVTVLARDAAAADAAATMIANAVDIDDPAVRRAPASSVKDDSDLGDRLITTEVGRLTLAAVKAALDAGEACARMSIDRNLVVAAALVLQGAVRVVTSDDRIRSQLRSR